MKTYIVTILLVLVTGCISVSLFKGSKLPDIPNFSKVDAGIYRGGQPTAAGVKKLIKLGVTNVVKLNSKAEGVDDPRFTIHYFPITEVQQLFSGPRVADVSGAVAAIKPGTFVHCGSDARTRSELDAHLNTAGGQDRTGLIIACYRVKHGWSKDRAEAEMLSFGFHKELLGLWQFWKHYL